LSVLAAKKQPTILIEIIPERLNHFISITVRPKHPVSKKTPEQSSPGVLSFIVFYDMLMTISSIDAPGATMGSTIVS
jgi:hypothetical protein